MNYIIGLQVDYCSRREGSTNLPVKIINMVLTHGFYANQNDKKKKKRDS